MPDRHGVPSVQGRKPAAPARQAPLWREPRAILLSLLVTALFATMFWRPRPLLVWNASASAPIGLYAVAPPHWARTGDMVAAWTPAPARALAAKRHYLPSNIPLIKRVRASGGDTVCAKGQFVTVNGRRAALRRRWDGEGRPMPWWTGCRLIPDGDYFLLMDSPDSFDGRYFGVTKRSDLIGRSALLWAR